MPWLQWPPLAELLRQSLQLLSTECSDEVFLDFAESGGRKLGVRDLPGPLSLPWLGTGWITSSMVGRYCLSQLHNAYKDMRHRYGPIVREEALGNVPVVSLFDAEAIEKVARYPSRYPIRPPTEISVVYRASRPDRYTNHGIVNE
ncbi:Cytochrome P450 [Gryllus bimaculatus]|nr:Cytochrome P450 [Gryllus bimaculatus]